MPYRSVQKFSLEGAGMSKVLDGKVALVTGGSRGIGAAAALGLADDGADAAISYSASSDRAERVVEQLESKGVRAAAFRADQASPSRRRPWSATWSANLAAWTSSSITPRSSWSRPVDDGAIDVGQLDR